MERDTTTLWKWKTHHLISDSLTSHFNASESSGKGSWWQAWWLIGQSDVSPTALCHLQAARCEQGRVILLFSQWYIWTRKIHPPVTGLNEIPYWSHLLPSGIQHWVPPPLDLESTEGVLGSPEGHCIFPYTEDGLVRSPQAKVCKPFKWCPNTAQSHLLWAHPSPWAHPCWHGPPKDWHGIVIVIPC